MVQVLGSFEDQVARQLTGRLPWRSLDGRWDYISAREAREEAGFDPMETFIQRRQNRVDQYIVM